MNKTFIDTTVGLIGFHAVPTGVAKSTVALTSNEVSALQVTDATFNTIQNAGALFSKTLGRLGGAGLGISMTNDINSFEKSEKRGQYPF